MLRLNNLPFDHNHIPEISQIILCCIKEHDQAPQAKAHTQVIGEYNPRPPICPRHLPIMVIPRRFEQHGHKSKHRFYIDKL